MTADGQYGNMLRASAKLGYDWSWGSFTADDCGAIHERRRWFLLAKGCRPEAKSWDVGGLPHGDECPILRTVMWDFVKGEDAVFRPGDDPTGTRRKQARRTMKLLGNAVVPAQARRALVSLLQKLSRGFRWPWMAEGLGTRGPGRWPQEGVLRGGRFLGRKGDKRRGRGERMDEAKRRGGLLFGFARATTGAARLPILEGTQFSRGIGTPRRLQGVASAPTRRTIYDFGTSVAFCLDLNRNTEPQGSIVKSRFICLAMGYPEDWTEQ